MARNQAPVAGAIRWSRSLFARCKRTHVLLGGMEPALLQESSGRQARMPCNCRALACYLGYAARLPHFQSTMCPTSVPNCQVGAKYEALACLLMAFEKKHYTAWLEPVEATIAAHLKQPLLREDPVTKTCVSVHSVSMHICTYHVSVSKLHPRSP